MTTPNDAAASGANNNAGQGSGAPAAGAPGSTGAAGPAAGAGAPAAGAAGAGNADERYGSPETGYDAKGSENLTDPLRADLHAYGKVHNLSPKAMTAMYEIANKHGTTQTQALEAAHKANMVEWAKESAADQEIGGERHEANKAIAAKGLETFGTPKLQTILKDSGLMGNPEFFRLLYRVGKAVSEDKFVRGGSQGGDAGSNSGLFSYPNSKHAA